MRFDVLDCVLLVFGNHLRDLVGFLCLSNDKAYNDFNGTLMFQAAGQDAEPLVFAS